VKAVPVRHLVALSHAEWDAALEAAGEPYRFSHRAAAGRAFEAAYREYSFEPYRVEFGDGAVMLVPLVRVTRRLRALTMMLGMPRGLEGTPLVLEGETGPGHIAGLFAALAGCGHLTINGGAGGSPPANAAAGRATTHVLDLTVGFEQLWNEAFSPKNRNKCRKAENAGVQAQNESTPAMARVYHEIYAAASAKWGYTEPPYPPELFAALLESPDAQLWIARLDQEPIAGTVLLRGSHDLLSWSTAILPGRQELAPNNALLRAAIEAACDAGVRYVDFGASEGLPGVAKFKESFGAQPQDYAIVELSSLPNRVLERVRP
jgi:hypothetical protein